MLLSSLTLRLNKLGCLSLINIHNQALMFAGNGWSNGTAHFEKYKQLSEYQNYLLIRDIWWSKFRKLFNFSTPVLISHLWQLKTVVFMNRCLLLAVLLKVRLAFQRQLATGKRTSLFLCVSDAKKLTQVKTGDGDKKFSNISTSKIAASAEPGIRGEPCTRCAPFESRPPSEVSASCSGRSFAGASRSHSWCFGRSIGLLRSGLEPTSSCGTSLAFKTKKKNVCRQGYSQNVWYSC
jgi:hypothetical protein